MSSNLGGEIKIANYTFPRIELGVMQLPKQKDPSIAKKILRKAYDSGIRFFDTALFYGDALSNKYLVEELGKEKDAMFVTKVGAKFVKGQNPPIAPAQKPEELREHVLLNLKSLNLKKLDIVFLRHIPEGSFPKPEDQKVDFKLQLEEMVKMRNEGLITNIGLSTVNLEQLKYAMQFGIVAVQNQYSLVFRDDEPVLEFCKKNNIAYLPYFPLGGDANFKWLKKVWDVPEVKDVAKEMGVSPAQVGLRWLLQHADNIMLIPGTSSLEHLEENMAVGNIKISEENMKKLDNVVHQK